MTLYQKWKWKIFTYNLLQTYFSTVGLANSLNLDKKCEDYKDSACKFWTFVPTRKICFLLSSCDKKDEGGLVSGKKGCKVPSKTFTVFNLLDAEVTNCKAKWEPTDVCQEQSIGTGGKIEKFGFANITYFTGPPSIGCTKITNLSCKWGTVKCKSKEAINVPIPNGFINKEGVIKQEIFLSAMEPKFFTARLQPFSQNQKTVLKGGPEVPYMAN